MISSDVRRAVRAAAGAAGLPPGTDPGLRPTGVPGQYAASAALALGADARATARGLAAALAGVPWIEKAEVAGPGYVIITVAAAALAAVADRIARAGPEGCAASDALAGATVLAAPPGDPLAAATWEAARAALAARLTARLAAAAGATVDEPQDTERRRSARPARYSFSRPAAAPAESTVSAEIAATVAFAGRDAVTFALARAIPGKPLRVEPGIIARHVVDNPAYAVRYAHARAASGVRWALASRGNDPPYPPLSRRAGPMAVTAVSGPPAGTVARGDTGRPARETEPAPRLPADPGELALLDALSWLPERVAVAARRGRPDEFARYLEELARVTVDALIAVSHPGTAAAPGSDRLTLARAARTGLAAGLGLLEVSAPERL